VTEPEFYPMPSFPTLAARDLSASLAWYRALGFAAVFETPGLAHLRWARYADLLVRPDPALEEPKGRGITLTFAVSEGLDALAERARAAGATFLREPGDRPWNARDFALADPDGYAIIFTMGPLKRDLSFEQVIANARAPQ
jgi:catechol 2,3-dioxygenase-like lactoylglutathione lyase family enzyme